jgi:hypothetical protein
MRQHHRIFAMTAMVGLLGATGCLEYEDVSGDTAIPLDTHAFPLPPDFSAEAGVEVETQIGSGYVTGRALEQPIQFPHYTHAQVLGMECQYCHSEARKSKHSGIPPVQSCMGCHQWVKTDQPEIQKLTKYWEDSAGPALSKVTYGGTLTEAEEAALADTQAKGIPWNKVHDIPDFVYFAHKPHIRAGVDCTECHGQMQLQGMQEKVQVGIDHETGDAIYANKVVNVVIRETTMQMGWCLDCHASHPSIDENYGDQAELRRAELKDCWTCHK